jgi:type II secretory pathway component GspD/PulD (secretin)
VQANKDANVIATPQIIALDNQKATIEISESIPVESTQVNGSVSTNSITQDKAQLLLTVTPQINKASNFVKLDIEQKLENFDSTQVPSGLSTKAKGKNMRSTNTSVIVQDEDTVVLSGLIRDSVDEVTNKIPILGDIPVLGWLFKNQFTEARKTNLLVFITPKIIKQYDSIRKILENRLSERDDFVREYLGSRDPFGRDITKMRKSLPDLTKVSPVPQVQPTESTSIPQPSSPDREDTMDEMYYDEYGVPPPVNTFDASPAGIPQEAVPGGEPLPPPPVIPVDPNYGGEY